MKRVVLRALALLWLSWAQAGYGGAGWQSWQMLSAPADAPAASPSQPGRVLITPPGVNMPSQVLDLGSGQRVNLPRSDRDRDHGHRDSWDSAFGGQELIRSDDRGGISLIAWPSLAVQASLRPRMAEGEVLRTGAIRMSRDRQWLAATVSSASNLKARLRVFDRQGNILAQGPEMGNRSSARYDWLPDGRLVFVDEQHGDALQFYDVAAGRLSAVPIRFPSSVEGGSLGLAASPDGQQLALIRYTGFKASGAVRMHAVLYLFPVHGGLGRALTVPGSRVLGGATPLRLFDLAWSAAGTHIAFTVSRSGDAYGAAHKSACSNVAVVNVLAPEPTLIDGLAADEPSGMRIAGKGHGNGDSWDRARVSSCGSFQWW